MAQNDLETRSDVIQRELSPEDFHGDKRFEHCVDDYSFRYGDSESEEFKHPASVIFHPSYTQYGIFLRGIKKRIVTDIAVLGFNVELGVGDCLEIHGGQGAYKPLSCVKWDQALLRNFIQYGRNVGLDNLQVLPAKFVEGMTDENYDRLRKRYDINAMQLGFLYSKEANRYMLDL